MTIQVHRDLTIQGIPQGVREAVRQAAASYRVIELDGEQLFVVLDRWNDRHTSTLVAAGLHPSRAGELRWSGPTVERS